MSMQDTYSDFITRIRNAQMARHATVAIPSTRLKIDSCKVLQSLGFIEGYSVDENNGKPQIHVELRYYHDVPVIKKIQRLSKPSLRRYCNYKSFPNVPQFGSVLVSTSKGVMSGQQAMKEKVGGELLLLVY